MIPFLIVLTISGSLAAWIVVLYNSLVRRRVLVTESWAQIDVELTRRHDLIPNLVATVKGYTDHENTTLTAVTEARAAATAVANAGPATRSGPESALSNALLNLHAVAEAYPDLKATHSYLALQNELTDTEDRIAAARRLYNGNVRGLNTALNVIPTNIVANVAGGFTPPEFFEETDPERRAAWTVTF